MCSRSINHAQMYVRQIFSKYKSRPAQILFDELHLSANHAQIFQKLTKHVLAAPVIARRKTTTYFIAAYVLVAGLGFRAKYKSRAEISSSGGHKKNNIVAVGSFITTQKNNKRLSMLWLRFYSVGLGFFALSTNRAQMFQM
jgi:hypothetical protein